MALRNLEFSMHHQLRLCLFAVLLVTPYVAHATERVSVHRNGSDPPRVTAFQIFKNGEHALVATTWTGTPLVCQSTLPAGSYALGDDMGASATCLDWLPVSVIYAATVPFIDAIAPTSGSPNMVIDITGNNLALATTVSFAGIPAHFSILQSTHIQAVVPTIHVAASTPVTITVGSAAGQNQANIPFVYVPPPPPMVNVPNVVGRDLQTAEQLIAQAELTVGAIIGSSAASALVISQWPTVNTSVPPHSGISLTTNTGNGGHVGSLTVTVGFGAGPGVACTGGTTITIFGPGGASNSSGQLNYGGTGQQVDATLFGCFVTRTFGNLSPGNWISAASTGGQCSNIITAGQLASRLIWEGVCF